jgi:hypothetical protein
MHDLMKEDPDATSVMRSLSTCFRNKNLGRRTILVSPLHINLSRREEFRAWDAIMNSSKGMAMSGNIAVLTAMMGQRN